MKQNKFMTPLLLIGCFVLAGTAFGQVVVDFPLEGSQEVPPVVTDASGNCSSWLDGLRTEFTIACTNNAVPTAAHIHAAGAGVNGPIVFFLEGSTDFQFTVSEASLTEQQDAMLPGLTPISFDEFLELLDSGDLYVNVHSAAAPGGELRGQIPPPPVETYFAQFGNGQVEGSEVPTLTSDIVLLNAATTGDPVTGTIFFFDAEGSVIPPDSLLGDGEMPAGIRANGSENSVDFNLDPLGNTTVSTSGFGDLVTGSVQVVSDGPVAGFIRFDITGNGVAGVRPSEVTDCALAPVRRDGTLSTGLAIRNVEARDLVVTMHLLDNGVEVDNGTTEFVLGAHARRSEFLEQYFTAAETDGFTGTVMIEADGAFAAITLEFDSFEGVNTTLPIAACIRD